MKASIYVAVENYDSKQIEDVKYADADVRELATVLEQHGFGPPDRELLIGGAATKTAIESVLRTTLRRLTKDDTLYLFYAGHGFSNVGESYLTCHDTRLSDLEQTSIPVKWILRQLQDSNCQRIAMFLDACSTVLLANEELRSSYGSLNDAELEGFFGSAEQRVCFTACEAGERSHPDSELKHRIWTYHVIQAFDGQNQTALQGQRLTASSLQNYLSVAVPAALQKTAPSAVQTPRKYGAFAGEFPLADLEEVFAQP